jgi:hypothetical protein
VDASPTRHFSTQAKEAAMKKTGVLNLGRRKGMYGGDFTRPDVMVRAYEATPTAPVFIPAPIATATTIPIPPGPPLFSGPNIKTPISWLGGEAYRLALYQDPVTPGSGVLVISMTLQFQFAEGQSQKDPKKTLTWTDQGQTNWATNYLAVVGQTWSNRYRLTTSSAVPTVRDVAVTFDFRAYIGGWHTDDDYELEVTAADDWVGSSCNYQLGNAALDSEDLSFAPKGGSSTGQRGAVHEFGHMLGLDDEYPAAKCNKHWLTDVESIMHSGEHVNQRHYAPFAGWITRQYEDLARLAKEPIDFKVEGHWDMSNSNL